MLAGCSAQAADRGQLADQGAEVGQQPALDHVPHDPEVDRVVAEHPEERGRPEREGFGAAGRAGLWNGRTSVLFDLTYRPVFEGTLGAWAARSGPHAMAAGRVLVELASPCQGDDAQLAPLLSNLAHDLVQWDLEDRGRSAELGKRGCDALADEARRQAEASLQGVTVDVRALGAEDRGLRQSRSNRGSFRLHGVSGCVELSGDLALAWPWLAALALRGAGQKRSFGLGEVRLWIPVSEE